LKAAGIERFEGDVRSLSLPDPRPPGAGETVIEVRAAAAAPWDEFVRAGSWDVGVRPPMALGVAASGTISSVGSGVERWSIGDEVLTHPVPLLEQGCWSELLLARADLLVQKPATVSWGEAAAFPVPALTGDQALDAAGGDSSGGRLFVNGAGGVTGQLTARLAVALGFEVAVTAGPGSAERLRRMGIAMVCDYHDEHWPAAIHAWGGSAGVPAAINATPGAEGAALAVVADGGRLATITGAPPAAERGVTIVDVYVQADGGRLARLAELLESGAIGISVGPIYELAEASKALDLAVRGAGGSSVVLRM